MRKNARRYKKIYCGGFNGVGKSSVLANIKRSDVVIVGSSKRFMKYLGLKSYDELAALESNYKNNKYETFLLAEIRKHKSNNIIFDAHYANFCNRKMIDVTGEWISLFDEIVLITTSNRNLSMRIDSDTINRCRRLREHEDSIDNLLRNKKRYDQHYHQICRKYNKKSCVIANNGNLDVCADKINSLFFPSTD